MDGVCDGVIFLFGMLNVYIVTFYLYLAFLADVSNWSNAFVVISLHINSYLQFNTERPIDNQRQNGLLKSRISW